MSRSWVAIGGRVANLSDSSVLVLSLHAVTEDTAVTASLLSLRTLLSLHAVTEDTAVTACCH